MSHTVPLKLKEHCFTSLVALFRSSQNLVHSLFADFYNNVDLTKIECNGFLKIMTAFFITLDDKSKTLEYYRLA